MINSSICESSLFPCFLYISSKASSWSLLLANRSLIDPKAFNHFNFLGQVAMNKFKKSQVLILSLVAALLFMAPLLSSSLRPTYLYFVLNLLIIALGAEAGLLSVFSRPAYVAAKPVTAQETKAVESSKDDQKLVAPANNEEKAKVVEKSASEKIVGTVKVDKVKKCPSTPSLFFIGSGEAESEAVDEEHEEEEEEVGGLSGPELFAKAEIFIGNFYKQLKMQREESWKRIHGFYQKAF
ncbi:hypothetical protein QUC31_001736 [Theobroma cacao]|uniref:Uncharacterized protein LOC18593453 n=2 Tax=Theobroma cacao TaxID=3641 RepID=A0AB32UXI8_THECC|nr:PREDICTED: uncharacterized protein LOC18593453 [Theobroma cacao]